MILGTHTGIHWARQLEPAGHRCDGGTLPTRQNWYVNVGTLGRPANDGNTNVWYTLLSATDGTLTVEFIPVSYDYETLTDEMQSEQLPDEFIETIRTGWWTTCLEILPAKERARGKY